MYHPANHARPTYVYLHHRYVQQRAYHRRHQLALLLLLQFLGIIQVQLIFSLLFSNRFNI